jgi:hypothetical protein
MAGVLPLWGSSSIIRPFSFNVATSLRAADSFIPACLTKIFPGKMALLNKQFIASSTPFDFVEATASRRTSP